MNFSRAYNIYCVNISMETILMSMKNSKRNELHKFFLTCHKYETELRVRGNMLLFKTCLFITSV